MLDRTEPRPVARFPQYEITAEGDLHHIPRDELVYPWRAQNGDLAVNLMVDDRRTTALLKLLVAEAFVPRRHPRETTVYFLNGDRRDCRAVNLAWGSRSYAIRYGKQMADHELCHRMRQSAPVFDETNNERFDSVYDYATTYGYLFKDVVNRDLECREQDPRLPSRITAIDDHISIDLLSPEWR